jgi:putative membrane protein
VTADKPFIIEMDSSADPALAPPVPDLLPDGRAMQAALRIGAKSAALGPWALCDLGLWRAVLLRAVRGGYGISSPACSPPTPRWEPWRSSSSVWPSLPPPCSPCAKPPPLRAWQSLMVCVCAQLMPPSGRCQTGHREFTGLYTRRGDMAWALSRLKERQGDVLDPDALLRLAEAELMAPLDTAARAEVEAAARQVATVTALVPLALADVAMALFANLRMIRRIAEIYGGRAGTLGSMRLLRRVFGHLIATAPLP